MRYAALIAAAAVVLGGVTPFADGHHVLADENKTLTADQAKQLAQDFSRAYRDGQTTISLRLN